MSKAIERLLDFEGKNISIVLADNQWWIPVKPVCDALNVQYERQFKNLKEDEILSQLLSKQTTVGADGKQREMVCVPEKYVYGWLFSIRSDSPELRVYKMKCYEILYNYFHGIIKDRFNVLTEYDDIDIEIMELQQKLLETNEYRTIEDLKKKKTSLRSKLKKLDSELKSGQTRMDM
jgi:hypothetical protein